MRLAILISILILLISCGKDPARTNFVSKEFESYVDEFIEHGKAYGFDENVKKIYIHFGDPYSQYSHKADCKHKDELNPMSNNETERVATCYWLGEEVREITVSESFWKKATQIQRRAIIFHELGHCTNLDRGHKSQTYKNRPISIMTSVLAKDAHNEKHWDSLVEELFTGDSSAVKESIDKETTRSCTIEVGGENTCQDIF